MFDTGGAGLSCAPYGGNVMLKAIIVEDEYLAREELAFLVGQHSNIEIVASFEDGLEAFKYLQDHEVDVVFLDIQIPAIDGLLLAKNLHKSSHPPHIVFVTAYKEFAVEAFELEAFDYILKPYNEPRLINLLQKLELAGKSQPQGAESGTPQNRTVNLVKGSASSSPLRADLLRGSRREADPCLHPYRSLRDDHDPQRVRQSVACRGVLSLPPLLLRQHQQDPRDSALVQQHLSHSAP